MVMTRRTSNMSFLPGHRSRLQNDTIGALKPSDPNSGTTRTIRQENLLSCNKPTRKALFTGSSLAPGHHDPEAAKKVDGLTNDIVHDSTSRGEPGSNTTPRRTGKATTGVRGPTETGVSSGFNVDNPTLRRDQQQHLLCPRTSGKIVHHRRRRAISGQKHSFSPSRTSPKYPKTDSVAHHRHLPQRKSGRYSSTALREPYSDFRDPLRMNPTGVLASTPIQCEAMPYDQKKHTYPSGGTLLAQSMELVKEATTTTPDFSGKDLKARHRLPSSKTAPRATRLRRQKSVLKKMTDAFVDRFHNTPLIFSRSRANLEEQQRSPARRLVLEGRGGSGKEILSPRTFAEIRANEYNNICRPKVQTITGYYKVQDCLVGDECRPTGRSSLQDPFSRSENTTRTAQRFQAQLDAGTKEGISEPSLSLCDPFKAEDVFDGNLNGVLPSSPLASSTPRVRLNCTRYGNSLESPTKRAKNNTQSRRLGAMILMDPSDFDPLAESLPVEGKKRFVLRGTSKNKCRPQGAKKILGAFSYVPVVGAQDRKKHPSPNKSDLEALEVRFRKHFPQLVSRAPKGGNETDELARSIASPFTQPPPGIENTRELEAAKDLVDLDAPEGICTKKRYPLREHPVDGLLNAKLAWAGRSQTQARIALSRDFGLERSDTDELQWDMESCKQDLDIVN
ncbi:hypothetical protein VTK73DRAFT_6711 [Phialemonium thermophilum]|uniref:Uncharacterized protein n=1 Tax=Phialemonium thermophilum TaxID=223376 RepID=A0ABR3XVZ7_9PEZI